MTENSIKEADHESEDSNLDPKSNDFTEGTKRGTTLEYGRTIENKWNNPPTPDQQAYTIEFDNKGVRKHSKGDSELHTSILDKESYLNTMTPHSN